MRQNKIKLKNCEFNKTVSKLKLKLFQRDIVRNEIHFNLQTMKTLRIALAEVVS